MEQPRTVHEILKEIENYSSKLALACNTNASNVIQAVKLEKITSKYWPAVERLAMEHNPVEYAARIKQVKNKIHPRRNSKVAA